MRLPHPSARTPCAETDGEHVAARAELGVCDPINAGASTVHVASDPSMRRLVGRSMSGSYFVELLLERRAGLEPKVPLPPLSTPIFFQSSGSEGPEVGMRRRMDRGPV